MREISLKVFHTSDLHFGAKSIIKDLHFPGQFEDYFSYLKDEIYDIHFIKSNNNEFYNHTLCNNSKYNIYSLM